MGQPAAMRGKRASREAKPLLIGYLSFRSSFLPRLLGAGMALAGLGWLTFPSPPLAHYLSPYILISGIGKQR